MSAGSKGPRRGVQYWAICPECFTYISVEGKSISREDNFACPYCEGNISLLGGSELSDNCQSLQLLIEDIERQIAVLPAAIDIHRFLFEQVDYIAQTFNDRLDGIQEQKDFAATDTADAGAPQAG